MARYVEALERYRGGRLSCVEAAELLGISERHFRRLRDRYEAEGAEGLIDRRRGRASGRRAPVDRIEFVVEQYRTRYWDFTVKHFHEALQAEHGFVLGYTWTKTVLQSRGLVANAPRRSAHRKKRPRRPMRGMMLHQDGSRHVWVEGLPAMDLIVTMDDATSEVYSMLLVAEEGTASTFEALREVIGERGLFCALYTDRGSHYFHTPEAGGKVSSTVQTQVGRALAHLGIEHIAAYSPQARGRSERLFATLQDRLPKELRLAGIPSVEAANAWLKSHYIAEHNARFAVDPEQEGSAFVPDEKEMWREILCSVEERTVANDNTVAWKGKRLQLPESRLRPHFVKAQVRVHEYPDGVCAVFLGPHRLADYDAEGAALRVPTAMKPGAVLGALKDKPCRARLRASLTAPARDASSAAQAGTRKRPPGRTRKQPHPSPAIGAPRPMKMGTIASP
jgi:transposase